MSRKLKLPFTRYGVAIAVAVVGFVVSCVWILSPPSPVPAVHGLVLQQAGEGSISSPELIPSSGALVSVTWMGQKKRHIDFHSGSSDCIRRVLVRADSNGRWQVSEWLRPEGSYVVSPFAKVHKTGYSQEVPADGFSIRGGKEHVTILRRSGPEDVRVTEEHFTEYSWGCETEVIDK